MRRISKENTIFCHGKYKNAGASSETPSVRASSALTLRPALIDEVRNYRALPRLFLPLRICSTSPILPNFKSFIKRFQTFRTLFSFQLAR
jgi:hypothetical protein